VTHLLAIILSLALAQNTEPPAEPEPKPEPPAETPTETPEQAPAEQPAPAEPADDDTSGELPSLDELLGLEEDDDGAPAEQQVGAEELDSLLTGEQVADEFTQAIDLMDRSAVRIVDAGDLSLTTQRLQQDVLDRLDKLIENAEQQEQQQQQSSSSSSSQDDQNVPQQQRGNAQQQQEQQGQGDSTTEANAPTGNDVETNDLVNAARAAWGALPQRVRDALVQGTNDDFSRMYQSLTEEYYRRLAEEPER